MRHLGPVDICTAGNIINHADPAVNACGMPGEESSRRVTSHMQVAMLGKRLPVLLAALTLGLILQASQQTLNAAPGPIDSLPSAGPLETHPAASASSPVFLPLAMLGFSQSPPPPPAIATLIGVYAPGRYWGFQSDVNQYLIALDTWAGLNRNAGKGHSLAGDYKDIQDPNISPILETLWTNGYTAFVNITANGYSSSQIANGCCDAAIRAWAQAYRGWVAKGGGRKAFLAPLQEMNGSWTTWGMDPGGFKSAYQRVMNIFAQQGVSRGQAWWVFAPNGWSTPPYHLIDYYPGDANVDVIGFSSYNQSYAAPWMNPDQVFGPYIQEIRTTVTSSRPIFVAQTASCSTGGDKDQWLRAAYAYLVQQNIRGVIYFNGDKECDWAVYVPGGRQLQGYKDAVSGSNTRYLAPAALSGTVLPP